MSEFNPSAPETTGGFERDLIPEGVFPARCVRVVEIGEQFSEKYQSKSNKCLIVLSLPDILMNFGGEEKQAHICHGFGITISGQSKGMAEYTKALNPNGTAQNLGDFLNQPCQISVKHNKKGDKIYANIDSIAPILPNFEVPELDQPTEWLRWKQPDRAVWDNLPEWMQNKALQATNFPGSPLEAMINQDVVDDLPM